MPTTTKFEDYLNTLLKSMEEEAIVEEYLFLANANEIRRVHKAGTLGSFIRKRDRYAFSEMENRHKRGEL